MSEEAACVLLTDRRERTMRVLEEGVERPGLRLLQRVLYLREGLLYGVVVRRVGRQEYDTGASGFDQLPYPRPLCIDRLSTTTICPGRSAGHSSSVR